MARLPLTFGVEIECLVSFLNPGEEHPQSESLERRFAHFPLVSTDEPHRNDNEVCRGDIISHIRSMLANAGFPSEKGSAGVFGYWEVDIDPSVYGPNPLNGGYKTFGIEIRSPAFYFCRPSIAELVRAIKMLNNTYIIHINRTAGLHVHVGNGVKGFELSTVRHLMAFLYAFEPQMNSLHPQSRFNSPFATSARYGSWFSQTFNNEHWRRPRPLEGVQHFLEAPSWPALQTANDTGPGEGGTSPAYRFDELHLAEQPHGDHAKLTVEFRQHGASIDSEEIAAWVKTTVGIVGFVLDSSPDVLQDLWAICEQETLDGPNGEIREPVLAETKFTILDLLKRMGLTEPLEYYRKKGLYRIRSPAVVEIDGGWPEPDGDESAN